MSPDAQDVRACKGDFRKVCHTFMGSLKTCITRQQPCSSNRSNEWKPARYSRLVGMIQVRKHEYPLCDVGQDLMRIHGFHALVCSCNASK